MSFSVLEMFFMRGIMEQELSKINILYWKYSNFKSQAQLSVTLKGQVPVKCSTWDFELN